MLKCSSERWVCAPQSLSAGTSTTPRLSVSFLISVMGTLLRSTTGLTTPLRQQLRRLSTCVEDSPRSSLWIWGPNVILRRHLGMARESTFGTARTKFGRLKRVGCWIIIPLGVCPSVRVRESLAILFDERDRFQSIRHVYKIRRLSVPFEGPLDLRNLGAVRKKLAVTGNAFPICVYHHVIRCDHFQAAFGLAHCNVLPGFVSSEVRPCEPVWYFQRVPVLRGKGQAAHDDRQYSAEKNRLDVFAIEPVCRNA